MSSEADTVAFANPPFFLGHPVSISVNKHTFINIIKGPYILYIHWGLI